MPGEGIVVDMLELDADPAAAPDVRRTIVGARIFLDERFLQAGRCGQPHADVPVMVVIVGKHREHALLREEGRLAVGDLLRGVRQRKADRAKTPQLPLERQPLCRDLHGHSGRLSSGGQQRPNLNPDCALDLDVGLCAVRIPDSLHR